MFPYREFISAGVYKNASLNYAKVTVNLAVFTVLSVTFKAQIRNFSATFCKNGSVKRWNIRLGLHWCSLKRNITSSNQWIIETIQVNIPSIEWNFGISQFSLFISDCSQRSTSKNIIHMIRPLLFSKFYSINWYSSWAQIHLVFIFIDLKQKMVKYLRAIHI